jgi:hypothetical protein
LIQEKFVTLRNLRLLLSAAVVLSGPGICRANGQQNSPPFKAVHLIGLPGVKDNAKGTLKAEHGQLHFAASKGSSDVSADSIEDVVTGTDTQAAVGKTISTLSIAAPYESGRFLALFRTKLDTLTIRYRDADGGLHGVIFTMPVGAAQALKKELLAQGAHAIAPDAGPPVPATGPASQTAVIPATGNLSPKIPAAAIQVEMIESDEIKLPAEFQIALYENLIRQLEKQGTFSHVYRDGDRKAANGPGLVVLHSTATGFKAGSERARQVTTVSGATSIHIHCRFSQDGKAIVERDVNGKVRFFGGNLKVTYDFAKKAAHVARDNFTPSGPKP